MNRNNQIKEKAFELDVKVKRDKDSIDEIINKAKKIKSYLVTS